MPPETTTTATEPAATDKPAETAPAATEDKPLGENGEKALKSERDARAAAEKSAAALQKQLDEINAANLSELERAQKEAADYKTAAETATANALRFKIAAEHGITENTDLILTGSDEETLTAQAKLWADRASTSPKPDLSQGGKTEPAAGGPAQDFANFLEAQMGTRG